MAYVYLCDNYRHGVIAMATTFLPATAPPAGRYHGIALIPGGIKEAQALAERFNALLQYQYQEDPVCPGCCPG